MADTDILALGATADEVQELWKKAFVSEATDPKARTASVALWGLSLLTGESHDHCLGVLDLLVRRLQMRSIKALMTDQPELSLMFLEPSKLIDNDVARRFLQLTLETAPPASGEETQAKRLEIQATAHYFQSSEYMTVSAVLALARVQAAFDAIYQDRDAFARGREGASDVDLAREILSEPANETPVVRDMKGIRLPR